LAAERCRIKRADSLTDNTDMVLAQTLPEIVVEDDYYSVKTIKKRLVEALGEDEAPK